MVWTNDERGKFHDKQGHQMLLQIAETMRNPNDGTVHYIQFMCMNDRGVICHCLTKTGMSMHFSTTIPRTIPLPLIAPRQTLSLRPDIVSEMFQLLHQVDEIDCGTSTEESSLRDLITLQPPFINNCK